MGNCFSVQLSGGDALVERCWDCVALRCNNLPHLRSNLQKLGSERDYLRALKDQVKQRVADQQGPQMKQLELVRVWVAQVENKLSEVDLLIIQGETEKNNLCLGGYCSKTCCSSYNLATMVVESLADVIALKERGNFDAVVERVAAEPEYISRLQKDLAALQAATGELKALKNDVIRRVNTEELPQMKQLNLIKVWISRVDLIIPECDSLIRDGPREIQRLRDGDLSFSDFGERVAKALADVMAEKQKGVFEAVVGRVPIEPVVERPGERAMGLESSIEEVWNWLMEEDVGVIGIYGMGGIGKTTLLTETNNRFLKSPHNFDFVIWVVASRDLKIDNMQEDIARQIGLSREPELKESPLSIKALIIHKILQVKKFILLIDDLWNRIDLKHIGVPLPNRENKSKVVFTTRLSEVCGEMEAQRSILLHPLLQEEAWKLFQEKLGRETLDADVDIPDLAKEVAEECAGLPLALVTIGRAMASRKTPQEWKHVLQILKTLPSAFPGMEDNILPQLKFSYDNLPDEKVRACFLYCSLFPNGYLIPKDELIQKWFCESFWDDSTDQIDPINEGYYIIATLVHACLLEDKGEHVKMHDTIRDMCLWVACKVEKEKENYFVQAGSQLMKAPNMEKGSKVKRISLMQNNIEQLTEIPNTSSLLTLFLGHNTELKMIGDGFFQYMEALRVLDLSNTGLTSLPTGIADLVSLCYLNISQTLTETLPWEMTVLKKLKCLNLEFMRELGEVRGGLVSSFPLLQILRMRACSMNLDGSMVNELESLENLKELSTTIRDLTVLLQLLRSCNLSSCIRHLEIQDIDCSSSSEKEEDRERDLFGEVIGTETQRLGGLQKILGKICFGNLHKLNVSRCHLQHLTWLLLAPNLTELNVERVIGLEEIISCGKLGAVVDPNKNPNLFKRLQVIELTRLPQLKSIWVKPLLFPSLDKIRIHKCPMLKKLPLSSESAKGRNLVIEGKKEWWDGLEWEDDIALTTFASCFRRWTNEEIEVTVMILLLLLLRRVFETPITRKLQR